MTIKKIKTLDNIIAIYGDKLPDNVVLAIYLEQANLPQAEVDFYIDRFNEERKICEAIEKQVHGEENISVESKEDDVIVVNI